MQGGIYEIVNLANDKKYIGSSQHLKQRNKEHFSQLKNDNHYNKHLQRAWNKFGSDNFIFNILEYVDIPEFLLDREQYYIDLFDVCNISKGYNINPNSSSMLGFNHSQETKENFSKDRMGDMNSFYGKHHSDETKQILHEKIRGENNSHAKLIEGDVLNVYKLLEEKNLSNIEIAKLFNIKENTVTQIKNGVIWKHLHHLYKCKDEMNRNQKLTEKEVLEIYKLLENNVSYFEISKKFNISKQSISSIKKGINWKQLFHFYNSKEIIS